jgi:hypothetical protein
MRGLGDAGGLNSEIRRRGEEAQVLDEEELNALLGAIEARRL